MSPGNLCNKLLHKLLVGPSLRKRLHVLEITRREPFHFGKRLLEICREAVDDFTPLFLRLTYQDLSPDGPIQQD